MLAGCGPAALERYPVSGTVSIEGNLVPEGRIRFVPLPETPSPLVEGAVKDGLFAIAKDEGPIEGKYRIEVVPATEQQFAMDDEAAYAKAAQDSNGAPVLPSTNAAQFANSTEEMIAEVQAGAVNDFNFQLRNTP